MTGEELEVRPRAEWERIAASAHPEGRALIDGKLLDSRTGLTFEDSSPIDGRLLTQIARCGAKDVDAAAAAARMAFETGSWRRAEPKTRKRVLLRFADLVRRDLERLALLETLDVGKPIIESVRVDVPSAADCIAYYAELADKLYDEVAPTSQSEQAIIRREPLGVIAAIVPWNYPLIITAWKIAPALLAGNSVILKPAEQSPLSAIRLGQLALEAGLPPGVLNVVPGLGEEAGKALALHPDVDAVSFTGSTEVGKLMLRYAGESNLKRVALECGGKSPQIVMADADIEAAASGIAWGICYNSGETCHAGSRVLCHAAIAHELVEATVAVARTIRLGHPLDPATRMGALIDERHASRVLGYIDSGVGEGARVALGGRRALEGLGGCYVEATILDHVRPDSRVAREEVFGPVLAVMTFEDEREAIELANDSPYGLAAGIWTSAMNTAHRLTREVRAGTVWVNTYDRSSLATPFGGFKQSGFGRDRSAHALDKYCDLKTIWTAFK